MKISLGWNPRAYLLKGVFGLIFVSFFIFYRTLSGLSPVEILLVLVLLGLAVLNLTLYFRRRPSS